MVSKMMEIKNTKIFGLEDSVERMGFPMRWEEPKDLKIINNCTWSSEKDDRLRKLGSVKSGTGHDNGLKGIIVQFDIKYPQYFTPQLQRYNWIDIVSSQSKMHTLLKRESIADSCNEYVDEFVLDRIDNLLDIYKKAEDPLEKKVLFKRIISSLPMGFELWMGISTNYLQLKTIYHQRRNHKLEEWQVFCDWIEGLTYFKSHILGDIEDGI